MALDLQVERKRVVEATNARDAAVKRLSDAYASLSHKTEIIERLQQELKNHEFPFLSQPASNSVHEATINRMKEDMVTLESIIKDLREETKFLKESANKFSKTPDLPPPRYEDGIPKAGCFSKSTNVGLNPG